MDETLGDLHTYVWLLGACVLAALLPLRADAQDFRASAVASSFPIAGEAADGDIIAYDPITNTYTRATRAVAADMFGIITDDPILEVADEVPAPGTRSLVRFGEALVNVSTRGGVVQTGDYITVSDLPGVGERSPRDAEAYLLGIALEDMTFDEASAPELVGGVEVRRGTVPIAIRFGLYSPERAGAESVVSGTGIGEGVGAAIEKPRDTADYLVFFRYLLAAVVAMVAILIAVKSFGGTLSQSIISVGRNPLARKTIVSMMLWNTMLIFLVSGAGLAIGAFILFFP